MPKNKVQQRVRQKRQAERMQRRRQHAMRKWQIAGGVVVALGVAAALVFGVKALTHSKKSAAISPASSATADCPQGLQSKPHPTYKAAPKMAISTAKSYTAAIRTTLGTIDVALDAKHAPVTVNSFVFLAQNHFFDCTFFHRVIPDFMIQGGDPKGTGQGGPGYQFKNETSPSDSFDKPGILAMANAGKDTNGSQFFITVAPYKSLDGSYTIFGHVVSGQDVADTISKLPRNSQDRPDNPPYILDITISVA